MRVKQSVCLLFGLLLFVSCSKPSYCECQDISSKALLSMSGIPSKIELSDLKDCADKVKEDLDLEYPSKLVSIELIHQVSYEMCKIGYFEGKSKESIKYYPKSQ